MYSHVAHVGADFVECSLDSGVKVIELALHLILWHNGREELHGVDSIHDVAILFAGKVHLDLGHGELLLGGLLGVKNGADAAIVEKADSFHHADGLPEGAVVIVIGEGVLLEELILDNSCSLKNSFLIFREGVLTDELDDFGELIFGLEDLSELLTKSHELGLSLGVMLLEGVVIVGERDVPVDGREMLTLSKLLIQSPENGHDGEGG